MFSKLGNQFVDLLIEVSAFLGGPRDDQRRPGLVDQNRVHFIDDCKIQFALRFGFKRKREIVPQVVEAKFVIGRISNVGIVSVAFLVLCLTALRYADREAQELVNRSHPVRVALRQIFVDGHNVDALSTDRVQVGGQCRHQGLTLAGTHFGDIAIVQYHAADELHIEWPQAEGAQRCFSGYRERFRK